MKEVMREDQAERTAIELMLLELKMVNTQKEEQERVRLDDRLGPNAGRLDAGHRGLCLPRPGAMRPCRL